MKMELMDQRRHTCLHYQKKLHIMQQQEKYIITHDKGQIQFPVGTNVGLCQW